MATIETESPYEITCIAGRGETIRPVAFPDVGFAVDEIPGPPTPDS